MADGLKIRIIATGEVITKSPASARALIERNEAELISDADADGIRVRVNGEIVTKPHGVALSLIARGEAEAL
jgi:hypothetical protein